MEWLKQNRGVAGILLVVLVVWVLSPSSLVGVYSAVGLVASLASIAFYGLGAWWFWRELNKKDAPKNGD